MIEGAHLLEFLDQSLWLLSQKAVYWSERRALLLSDLHLGKAEHFQRAGIPIPTHVHQDDLQTLEALLVNLPIQSIYVLGDLFHSSIARQEAESFLDWKQQQPKAQWTLIKGNHDLYSDSFYRQLGFEVMPSLTLNPFILSHHPPEINTSALYSLSGHIHPGVRLYGKARQSMSLPCFYFGPNSAILPAFGRFTGYVAMPLKKNARVYAITDQKVLSIKP